MPTYVYKCPRCGREIERKRQEKTRNCLVLCECKTIMKRKFVTPFFYEHPKGKS